MDETFEKVKALMIKEFDIAPEKIAPTTELASLGVDSLAALEFVFVIEEAFGVTVDSDTDLRGGRVQDVVDVVTASLSRQPLMQDSA